MTKQRLDILNELNLKLDKIIQLLEVKKNVEPDIKFTKANNVENSFIKDRQTEIFKMLDGGDK